MQSDGNEYYEDLTDSDSDDLLQTDRIFLPQRYLRSMRYKTKPGLADRGMMMGLGKRVIADKGLVRIVSNTKK